MRKNQCPPSGGDSLKVEVRRRPITQGLVRAFVVVEVQILLNASVSLLRRNIIIRKHFFVLDRAP